MVVRTATPFSQEKFDFSGKGHLRAQTDIYPLLFKTDREHLEFTALPQEQARTLDGDMGIDRIVEVKVHNLLAPLTFLVQERFRRPNFYGMPDITITEWNNNSCSPSELYKIKAGLFLYAGYYERTDRFEEAIVVSVCPLLFHLARGSLDFTRHLNSKNQSFIAIKVPALEKLNLIHLHKKWETPRQVNPKVALEEGMKKAKEKTSYALPPEWEDKE